MSNPWELHRAGLFNFWYYDDEEFDFSDGKLLLRGTNGSGKSVTMQSLLPVLLDGKKSPDRLDPFGSRSRRMADYLLGEKEVSNRDERTGYLYLEYKKKYSNQYLTTGMGMQAKRNQALKSWGFVITDNRRIGKEINVYKYANHNGNKEKFPLSQMEWTNLVGDGGEVVSSNHEYMKLVNRHVFGFESLEAYEDLIKLLIQLRSPKLSKDFKPTVIYEILEEALPPLTDEDLRHLSDSIEQMDQTKQQIEQLEREVRALESLNNVYSRYNERVLADLAQEWFRAKNELEAQRSKESALTSRIDQLKTVIETKKERQRHLEISRKSLEEKARRLETHEIFQLEETLQESLQIQREIEKERNDRQEKVDKRERKERQLKANIDELEAKVDQSTVTLTDEINQLEMEAEEAAFAEHSLNIADYEANKDKNFPFNQWKEEIDQHTKRLEQALSQLREKDTQLKRIEEKNGELGEAAKTRDHLEAEYEKWQQFFEEEKQKLINATYIWHENNQQFAISEEVLTKAVRKWESLFAQYDYDEVKALFTPLVTAYQEGMINERARVAAEAKKVEQEQTLLKEELTHVKAQRDPEPPRHAATEAARAELNRAGVSYAPFYELVEFRESVPEQVQKQLESALMEMGVLDALVCAEDIAVHHDRILVAGNTDSSTGSLANFLRADTAYTTIEQRHVENVIANIDISKQAYVHVCEDGTYQLGAVHGHAVPVDDVRYIGKEARKRHRQRLIKELEAKIEDSQKQVLAYGQQLEMLNKKIKEAQQAWADFPQARDAREAYDEMKVANRTKNEANDRVNELAKHLERLDAEFQQIRRNLFQITEGIKLPLETNAYQNALLASRTYEKGLHHVIRLYDQWNKLREDLAREQRTLVETEEEVNEYKGELASCQDRLQKVTQKIKDIEAQQQLAGAEDIKAEIRATKEEQTAVDSEYTTLLMAIPGDLKELERAQEEKVEVERSFAFWLNLETAWKRAIEAEWKRGSHTANSFDLKALELLMANRPVKEKHQLEGELTNLYYRLQPDLIEHKMKTFTHSLSEEEWMRDVDQAAWRPLIEQWKQKTSRTIIEFDQRGVKISPQTLLETTSATYAEQENRLDAMDKRLYEEILLHSVGHKLRGRIRRAEQWTEKMKKLMESRDTSSGLKFSIRWRPKTADSEQELDTKDLVSLLKQDAKLLKQDDLERMTNHFRSKIAGAKQWLEEKGEGETLLQVLKMVLDYRKWFSFELYYERPNEPRRELTNHKFFTFSGGEKAMAMYIPLFTACYSRYQEAADFAPYIITLDEAFAGVDEKNINEMFDIVEQLGFNYIMNSQVLWGDYEAISSLAICELIRPKNANFVAVSRYKWDGQRKQVAKGSKELYESVT